MYSKTETPKKSTSLEYNTPALSSIWPLKKKEVKMHLLQAKPQSEVNIFTNSNETKTCLLLCLLCISKFQLKNTYLLEFVNMLRYVKTNPIWMCC